MFDVFFCFVSVRNMLLPDSFMLLLLLLLTTPALGQDYAEEDEDYEYGDANAEGGLTGSDNANEGAGAGAGAVDLLSMDDLSVNDPPPAAAAVAPVAAGGMEDLFGGGGGGGAGAAVQPQAVVKTVRACVGICVLPMCLEGCAALLAIDCSRRME